ncbi:chitin synthesis regulation, resistance to congo red-domain-containing protein [Xylariales sp. PMI_506]|nr:chitin synthesis regulation, resistance to congo red-domain-containing protein [Xylariales sp. PMI_506]
MAPTLLSTRAYCDGYGYCYSNWTWYGRWIFAGVVIVVLLAIVILWACVNSRRRRRTGQRPMYGTGWMAPQQQGYQNNPQGYYPPPPAYGVQGQGQAYPMENQYTGTTFNQNDGYYGQREGVQPPKNVYGGANDYAPPEGPPPNKATHP